MASITNDQEHALALKQFEQLASADEAGNYDELIELRDAIAAYELAAGHYPLPPATVRELILAEMFKRRINQGQLAHLLGLPQPRLSEYMNRKRELNIDLARRLYAHLGISAELLLSLDPA